MAQAPDGPITVGGPFGLDFTIEAPGFASMLDSIVGNAGGPGDGFELLLADFATAIIDTASLIGDTLNLLDDSTTHFLEGDSIAASTPDRDFADGTTAIGNVVTALEQHFGNSPTLPDPTGGGSGNTGVPQGFDDVLDFGTVVTHNADTAVIKSYTWGNNTANSQEIVELGITAYRFTPAPPGTRGGTGQGNLVKGKIVADELKAPILPGGDPAGSCTSPADCNLTWFVQGFKIVRVGKGKTATFNIGFVNYSVAGLYEIGWGPVDASRKLLWDVYSRCQVNEG